MFSIFKNKNIPILVTGGTGFAGSHLIQQLVNLGYKNIHTTSYGSKNSFADNLISAKNIHKLDLTDKKSVFNLFKEIKPKQIYHLAAISEVGKSFDEASKIINNNISLQLNVLEAVKEIVPESRILIVGSALEYDFSSRDFKAEKVSEQVSLGPANPYGVSKVAQDLLGLSYHYSYKLDIVRVRPFNHIGERQAVGFVVSDFAKQIAAIKDAEKEKIIKVGNLNAVRDFTDVKDVIKAYILIMERGKSGEVYNVGTGAAVSMQNILDMLIEISGSKVKVEIDKNKFRPLDVPRVVADNRKIVSLGWKPSIPLKETLIRVLKYWRSL